MVIMQVQKKIQSEKEYNNITIQPIQIQSPQSTHNNQNQFANPTRTNEHFVRYLWTFFNHSIVKPFPCQAVSNYSLVFSMNMFSIPRLPQTNILGIK